MGIAEYLGEPPHTPTPPNPPPPPHPPSPNPPTLPNPPTPPSPPPPPHPPHHEPHTPHDDPHHNPHHYDRFHDIPSGLELVDCITGENFEEEESDAHLRAASVRFEVPKVDTLFFISRGQQSGGAIHVLSTPDQAADSVTIKVTARYILDKVRDLAKVCLSTRGEGAGGVGAFVRH